MSTETSNYETSRIRVMLESEEKKRRTQGLKEILKILELAQPESELRLWDAINKPLLRILNDSAEICRDRSGIRNY